VEQIVASDDWMEVILAVNLCFDPLFGELARVGFFSRFAAANGDVVTPILVASSESDAARTLRWTRALVTHVLDDAAYGQHNRELIRGWVQRWNTAAGEAAEAFQPLFGVPAVRPSTFGSALTQVRLKQAAVLDELGLDGLGTPA